MFRNDRRISVVELDVLNIIQFKLSISNSFVLALGIISSKAEDFMAGIKPSKVSTQEGRGSGGS